MPGVPVRGDQRSFIDPVAFLKLQSVTFFEGISFERQLIDMASFHLPLH
jgi:hypothetical protein